MPLMVTYYGTWEWLKLSQILFFFYIVLIINLFLSFFMIMVTYYSMCKILNILCSNKIRKPEWFFFLAKI